VIFRETALAGAFVIDLAPHADERGFFARAWCAREFADHGLETRIAQCSVSRTIRRGTLRGLHYQRPPHAEVKVVRCIAGAVHDVIVDLRPESATYRQHVAVELSADNHRALYVPAGFAHGFLTLTDDVELFYQMSEFHAPDAGAGVRWDDPAFAIQWPLSTPLLNERDRTYPDFVP
jgi:dTDP-4-dehydrorhamnose 3,5-epimerase